MIEEFTILKKPLRLAVGCVALAVVLPHPAWTPEAAVEAAAGRKQGPQHLRAREAVTVYWVPRPERPRRAIVESGAIFSVIGKPQPGEGCQAGWAEVVGGGYACLDETEPVAEQPRPVPPLLDGVVPFVYVHRKGDPGYKLAYQPASGKLTAKSDLVRMGKALDVERYERHEPSRFQGRDLEKRPLSTAGFVVGFTVAPDVPVYRRPGHDRPTTVLPLHTELLVKARPEKHGAGTWHEVRKPGHTTALGFMDRAQGLRHWINAPVVEGVADDEVWVDIELSQQMIALRKGGKKLLYLTLISGGLPERPTPTGVYRITHKMAYRTMGSLPDSADKYFIENVPWTMYFRPHYALHGAYWHDEFGNQRSHGCVNLAPRDAAHIYERVAPHQQAGFFTTFASDKAQGSIVRIRQGTDTNVPDLRDQA